jgi:hypothetical protein
MNLKLASLFHRETVDIAFHSSNNLLSTTSIGFVVFDLVESVLNQL